MLANQFLEDAKERIIVALDVPTVNQAGTLARDLAPHVGGFKVGKELTNAAGGPFAIQCIRGFGPVFYDEKFYDTPGVVGKAAENMSKLGVAMFTVSAQSGIDTMKAAVANKGGAKVIAVTKLTSLSTSTDEVLSLAYLAVCAGVDGIVCSAWEAETIRTRKELAHLHIITPGIRPSRSPKGDQVRVATPEEAIYAGADQIVVGRPIIEASDPVLAAKNILAEVHAALSEY